MPKRIAVNTLFIYRDKKRKKIMPGESVDLTDDELKDLNANAPDTIRKPINEGGEARQVSVGKAGAKPEEI